MKAALLHAPKQALALEEVDLDDPRPGEVRVRLRAAGVCHTDYHFMSGDRPLEAYPVILGHEGAGVVEAVGAGVTRVGPGAHVVLARPHCGDCAYCERGQAHLCRTLTGVLTGLMADGSSRIRLGDQEVRHFGGVSSFAEATVIPEQGAVEIPKDVPFEIAALVGCAVLTGVGAVKNAAEVEADSRVLVIGVGGVGLNAVMGARLAGAAQIIAADPLESRLAMAEALGATATIPVATRDIVEAALRLTDGGGVDYALDTTGNGTGLGQAYRAIRRGGTAVAVGMADPDIQSIDINPLDLVRTQKTIRGSYMGSAPGPVEIPALIDLYRAGKLPLDQLPRRSYPLAEINKAFEAMMRGEVGRAVVIP